MNRNMLLSAVLVVLLITVFSFAANDQADRQKPKVNRGDQPQTTEPQVPQRPVRPRPAEDRRQMVNQMMAQRGTTAQDYVQELEELKKVAQEENATKTVAAIDALIEKKQSTLKQAQAEQEKRRDEFRQRMQDRMNQRQNLMPVPERQAATETPAAHTSEPQTQSK